METYDERRARRKLLRDLSAEVGNRVLDALPSEKFLKCARWGAQQVCLDGVAGRYGLTPQEAQALMEKYLTAWIMKP